jgi:hypothetical protein
MMYMKRVKSIYLLALLPVLGSCGNAPQSVNAQENSLAQQTQAVAQDKVLIDTDFGAPGVKSRDMKSEKVNGSLAEPWEDESNWAPLRANYQSLSAGGETFQRLTVSQLQSGRAQIVHALPALSPDAMYVLEMTLRGAPASAGVPQTPLTLAVRQRESPYEFLWQEQVLPTRDWQTLTFTFSPRKSDAPVGFYIMTDSNGTVDVDRIKLSATTREGYIKTLEAKYPGGGPRNLLTQTRFPLGLPAGWKLDTNWGDDRDDAAEPQVGSDNKTIGPSGSPALHVQGRRAFILNSVPFAVVLPHRRHVASVAMRGSGNGWWGVYVGDREIARQEIKLDNAGWKRYELEFPPDLTAKSHTLRFQSEKGFDLWLDAVQVASDQSPREYTSQMPAEIALSAGSPAGIHFSDEPAQVKYFVSNAPQGSTLKFRVANLYGEETAASALKLNDGTRNGNLNYALFPQRSLGVHRVEVWVEDGAGKQISPYSEVVVNRLQRPRYWMKDAPDSPFGVHAASNTRHILMAKSMGINWVRLHDSPYIGWDYLEREKGKWNFRDAKIQRYRKHNIKLLGGLSTTPQWARTMKESHDGYADLGRNQQTWPITPTM